LTENDAADLVAYLRARNMKLAAGAPGTADPDQQPHHHR